MALRFRKRGGPVGTSLFFWFKYIIRSVTNNSQTDIILVQAKVAKLADALGLGPSTDFRCAGSSPVLGTHSTRFARSGQAWTNMTYRFRTRNLGLFCQTKACPWHSHSFVPRTVLERQIYS